MSDAPHEARQLLTQLKQRLVAGEIDEATYQRQREWILADLTAAEREALGVSSTPQPVGALPPLSVTSTPVGPSGGRGGGARTALPKRASIEFEPGEVLLDQWRLERELGRGGFGVVFEATDQHLKQRQAVKVLDPRMVENADLLARFRREVLVMRQLVHPRIVRVFDYRESPRESLALLSMELVEGCSLRELKERAKAEQQLLPVPQVLIVLQQVLEALAAAHTQGVIHRDVSPGNVLLGGGTAEELLADPGRDPEVKLVDFGIAGLLERTELSAKSRALGTAAYVAPEVLDLAVEISPAVDVYGAGAVTYELLTGTLPLGRFREPSAHRADLPTELGELVLGLLDPVAGDRPSAGTARSKAEGMRRRNAEVAKQHQSSVEFERALELAMRNEDEGEVRRLVPFLESQFEGNLPSEIHDRARGWLESREAERRRTGEDTQREALEERRRRREAEEAARLAERRHRHEQSLRSALRQALESEIEIRVHNCTRELRTHLAASAADDDDVLLASDWLIQRRAEREREAEEIERERLAGLERKKAAEAAAEAERLEAAREAESRMKSLAESARDNRIPWHVDESRRDPGDTERRVEQGVSNARRAGLETRNRPLDATDLGCLLVGLLSSAFMCFVWSYAIWTVGDNSVWNIIVFAAGIGSAIAAIVVDDRRKRARG